MKKSTIHKLLLMCIFFTLPKFLSAQSPDNSPEILTQRVSRFSSPFEPWNAFRGELKLKDSEMTFTPKNAKNRGSFLLEYKDLISVKRRCLLIFPNYIVITDKNFAKYKIGTYRRKKIVETINSKI
ncbi:MAG: hypothetical protein Q8S14_02685 [Algoriphagus sp.]|uniref:hypothetical protein n=1 Tax=Algoriphagus sp. TaxID=1872435 RepID=UPI0027252D7F|nr:hypothetical protein [Algoriphagus sp.]MDO8967269.1 hypothetical protein [Algoriphagus sp.]MDP2039971.1 hypothetical protein [Algoriphagus sp.]MDP3199631.1 hypothetical protein [Algoriphagus sp.]MDP3470755.1 hypothetical protein [Algoriphagus sp.]